MKYLLHHCRTTGSCIIGPYYRVSFFLAPPNLTMSQAHHKFLYLENFRGGQFKLYRAWDLVKLGGARQKKTPCIFLNKSIVYPLYNRPIFPNKSIVYP